MMSVHTSRDFEAEMRQLRVHTLAMGARCERSVGLALEAFWLGAADLAGQVHSMDAHIDRDEIDINALAMRILALRQPVAHDLRFLTAALKLVTDLERIGDEAVNIAERAVEGDDEARASVRSELESMAREAQDMLRQALKAFVEEDCVGAERVLHRDDSVDRRCGEIIAQMSHYIAHHSTDVPAGLRVVRVAKYIERIADHATNVAEEVIFMCRGEDVRHARCAR